MSLIPDPSEYCQACQAHYLEPHKEDCKILAVVIAENTRNQKASERREQSKGTKIAEGEDGVYVAYETSGDPIVVVYNEGGHNSTSVSVRAILAWVAEFRRDLLPKMTISKFDPSWCHGCALYAREQIVEGVPDTPGKRGMSCTGES